jgi:23S rRNA (cytidine1920-2'-O)/16S rRNA (cytidine1409-2'-O)-methyltransferase
MGKIRIDMLLVEQGLVESREQAQRLIMAGEVRVKDQVIDKPSHKVEPDSECILKEGPRFVSRGGLKLEAALDAFSISAGARVCIDVGASTGGFTDCLLQAGAEKVFAIDVGKGQVHWNLRKDERVIVMEGINARELDPAAFDPRPDFACVDVSFISLTKVLPAVIEVLDSSADIVTLIKPQFEAGREQVGKGGVVKDPEVHDAVVERVREFGTALPGISWEAVMPSPIKGPAGNVEFLAHWKKHSK